MRSKQYYRNLIKKEFRRLSREELMERSELLLRKLAQERIFKRARKIMGYEPFGDEVDIGLQYEFCTFYLKTSAAPQVKSKADARSDPPNSGSPIFSQPDLNLRLHKSFLTKRCKTHITHGKNKRFFMPKMVDGGIEIEVEVEKLDLIIVPGRAFTLSGIRIGRGGGAYDRFLSSLPEKIPTISLALDFQIFNNLPCEKHDVRIDKVIVEI